MHGCWAAWVRLRVEALRSAWAGPFSFAVPAGGCLAITGASGSGKSLLLHMIADLDLHEGEAWLDGVLVGAASARAGIEAQLMLGRSYWVALRPLLADSIQRGLMPAVNQMAAAGLATLPGIMTGQILAGADPVEAVKYQILLMLLLSGAGGLAAGIAAMLGHGGCGWTGWLRLEERRRNCGPLRLQRGRADRLLCHAVPVSCVLQVRLGPVEVGVDPSGIRAWIGLRGFVRAVPPVVRGPPQGLQRRGLRRGVIEVAELVGCHPGSPGKGWT